MEAWGIPSGGGLDALALALSLRACSFVNPSRTEREGAVLRWVWLSS